MHRTSLGALLFAFFSPVVAARTLMPIGLDQLAKESAVIAAVEIESAAVITSVDGVRCGVGYVARVTQGVKGASDGERIRFGSHLGIIVGKPYVLLLSSPGARYDFTLLPFALEPTADETHFQQACGPVLPPLRETYDGLVTLPVEPGNQLKWEPSVRLTGPHLIFPGLSPVFPESQTLQFEDGEFAGPVQVSVQTLLQALKRMVKP